MSILFPKDFLCKISISIIWLFHFCGALGIIYGNKELFLSFTPINLFISFLLLFVNQNELENKNIITAMLIFTIGMIAEILGVNYGIIFGEYIYLDNLGYKIMGVPVMIGIQWIILTFITGSFTAYVFKNNKFKAILAGVILLVVLDILIEPVAPSMGFWIFSTAKAPIQNYFGWFLVSVPVQMLFHYGIERKDTTFSFHLLIIQFLFFGIINILAL
jgi:putative membrane protein